MGDANGSARAGGCSVVAFCSSHWPARQNRWPNLALHYFVDNRQASERQATARTQLPVEIGLTNMTVSTITSRRSRSPIFVLACPRMFQHDVLKGCPSVLYRAIARSSAAAHCGPSPSAWWFKLTSHESRSDNVFHPRPTVGLAAVAGDYEKNTLVND